MTRDNIKYINDKNPQTLNLYEYCGDNPVSNVDPSGNIYGIDDLLESPEGQELLDEAGEEASTLGEEALNAIESTGRTIANSLCEKLAMEEVVSNPLDGATKVDLEMGDSRWPADEGWMKMQRVFRTSTGNITIHFNYNDITGATADFKYVYPK